MNKPFSYREDLKVSHEPKPPEVSVQSPKVDLKVLEEKIDDLSKKIDSLYSLVEKLKGIYK